MKLLFKGKRISQVKTLKQFNTDTKMYSLQYLHISVNDFSQISPWLSCPLSDLDSSKVVNIHDRFYLKRFIASMFYRLLKQFYCGKTKDNVPLGHTVEKKACLQS